MPTKRRTLDRPRRRSSSFSAETVAMFKELDSVPARLRDNENFKAKERELMARLDLADEWRFSVCSVLYRERGPCREPTAPASIDWFKCRAVREQLLAAAGSGKL
jgi:hypothetical protein